MCIFGIAAVQSDQRCMIAPVDKKIFTVSRLNQEVQRLLETGFGTLWLQGELSNFSRPASGHFYFSLKDSQSQIRCAMFKGRNRYVDFKPGSGDAVIVRGKLGLYSARGDFQLIVEHMEPAGAGKLQAAFEATKRDLDSKGWFDAAAKLPLPSLPRSIGVVTSPTSAALRDVLQVLNRRYRQARIIIYPTLTQGSAAAPAIVNALQQANQRQETDILLLVRGGGSLEDLWAFNEVSVAAAIRDSQIPIVAGIGHEVDVTISDLVSDLRAPTPSAAAELATPDNANLIQSVNALYLSVLKAHKTQLTALNKAVEQQSKRLYLRHPRLKLQEQSQRVDELEMRLSRAWNASLVYKSSRMTKADTRLSAYSPTIQVAQYQKHTKTLNNRLSVAIENRQKQAKSHFDILARALHGVSPLAVLDRGYAIVKKNKKPIMSAEDVAPGDEITARLSNGEFQAVVSTVKPYF
jgi:exodeoxyribonuclease VII large subunit